MSSFENSWVFFRVRKYQVIFIFPQYHAALAAQTPVILRNQDVKLLAGRAQVFNIKPVGNYSNIFRLKLIYLLTDLDNFVVDLSFEFCLRTVQGCYVNFAVVVVESHDL